MPAVLRREDRDVWLSGGADEARANVAKTSNESTTTSAIKDEEIGLCAIAKAFRDMR